MLKYDSLIGNSNMPESTPRAERAQRYDLRSLYETSRLLSSSIDLDFVLSNMLLTAMSKLLVMRGAALLYDPLEGAYRAAVVKGVSALSKGALIRLDDYSGDAMLQGESVPKSLFEKGLRLTLPVGYGHRRVGLIGLGPKATGQAFEESELEFVQLLVNMSAAAVHNSLIVKDLKQANRDLDGKIQQLNTLFDLSQEFNATVERGKLVRLFSFALMGQMLVGKHVFFLRRPNPESGKDPFDIVSMQGIGQHDFDQAFVDSIQELALVDDGSELGERHETLRRNELVLALPIRQQGDVRGVLCLGPKMTGQPYQPDDIEFLYSLGSLAVVSIQNVEHTEDRIEKQRLEEELRHGARDPTRAAAADCPSCGGAADGGHGVAEPAGGRRLL